MMPSRRPLLIALAGLLVFAAAPAVARSRLPKGLDADHDGTVDLAEAKNAASALFDRLDRDHEGTLDAKELHVRLKKGEIAGADPDKDATLTKDEFLALVERRFKAADVDSDGTLNAAELHSKAGRALLKLLQ